MKDFLTPLERRTTEYVAEDLSPLSKTFGILIPIFVYRTVDTLLVAAGAYFTRDMQYDGSVISRAVASNSNLVTVIIKMIALLVAAGLLIPTFKKEKPVIINREVKNKDALSRTLSAVVLGVASSIFFNILFTITGITGMSATYTEVANRQFSFNIGLGILIYGLLAPFTEELVFRGIVYNRIRRNYGLIMGLIFSPLLFGAFHGNVVQMMYGFLMGLLITWVYERFGSFIYPCIIHMCANTIIYTLSSTRLREYIFNIPTLLISLVITVVVVIYIGALKKNES